MKKRLLFMISRFLDGGIDTVLIEYLQCLCKDERYEITLCCGIKMDELEVYKDRLPKNINLCYLVGHPFLTRWKKQKITQKLPFWIKSYDELCLNPIRRFMFKRKIDRLVDMYDVVVDFDCSFYSFLKNVPKRKIAFFHFSFEQSFKVNPSRIMRLGKKMEVYDKIVTISMAMQKEGCSLFPKLADKFVQIYNAVDIKQLEKKSLEQVDDERIKVPYILAIERLQESQKDISSLLKAYKQFVIKYGRTEKLYIIGKGHSEDFLKKLAQELGLSDRVVFLGFVYNPYPWIRNCKLFVHSAKFEGLPTVLIEALSLRKLILSTDCPTGPREILADGKAGVLVPVGDVDAISSGIYNLLTNKKLQEDITEQMNLQMSSFSFEQIKMKFEKLL